MYKCKLETKDREITCPDNRGLQKCGMCGLMVRLVKDNALCCYRAGLYSSVVLLQLVTPLITICFFYRMGTMPGISTNQKRCCKKLMERIFCKSKDEIAPLLEQDKATQEDGKADQSTLTIIFIPLSNE